ncbi:MAG TPA: hypothetical protein VFQ61_31285 [Polyangiaceae bacterium]|nr:hypothetical protein [Polyangiaceae bacterium]
MPTQDARPQLEEIASRLEDILTLTEGLEQPEFARSRITRQEVYRQLQAAATDVCQLSSVVRETLAELDFGAWQKLRTELAENQGDPTGACWSALLQLVPDTLSWLRVHGS